MERLPKDVLGLIFARCRPLELVRLAGVCQWLRRCVLLRVCTATGVVSCPPTTAFACEALMGPRWSEMLECRMPCREATAAYAAVKKSVAKAIARAEARGAPEPVFSRNLTGGLRCRFKHFTRCWLVFRLGTLYRVSHAAPGQKPLSWEKAIKGHRYTALGRAEVVECVTIRKERSVFRPCFVSAADVSLRA
jgi:hypothetical protein